MEQERIATGQEAATSWHGLECAQKLPPGSDMEEAKPGQKRGAQRRGKPHQVAEIDDMQAAVRP